MCAISLPWEDAWREDIPFRALTHRWTVGSCTADGSVELLQALTSAGCRGGRFCLCERSPLVPGPCGDAELGNTSR